MSSVDNPSVPPLHRGGGGGGGIGGRSHYTWVGLLVCSIAIAAAAITGRTTIATSSCLSLLLVSLVIFILPGAGDAGMVGLGGTEDHSTETGKIGTGDSDSLNPSDLAPMENAGWRFELEGTSIVVPCEGPPWQTVAADATVILAGLGRRFNGNGDSHTTSEENRLNLWGTVQLANSGLVSERTLFESQNMDKRIAFILRSSERSEAPLQWLHIGHGTIPNKLADASCIGGHREELLCILNHIFQTRYSLDTPGLDDCLQYFVQQSRDLGELYGYLRPWWYGNLRDAVQKVAARKDELEAIRHNAIRDSCIQNSNIPPRRVWDLYSNRVLPLHAVPRDPDSKPEDIPSKVWCVSHSWVEDHRHVYVSTEINGQQWPVPIPRETTLDHVRIELLNMDAEYAWLDVLCLRQRGRDEDEMQRQEEWKLDVPTIGYTYSRPSTPCVIYFNGLGLPLDTSPIILRSTRQWFNRVWTLQESPLSWLPGGLSGKPLVDPHAFFDRLRSIVTAVNSRGDGSGLAQTLRERSCTNELDRIAGLAYIFQCRTLPIYNENVSPEVAWTLLLKHMDAERRTSISLQYPPCSPFGLWGSWERFLHSSKIPHASQPLISAGTSEDGSLKLVDPSQLYTDAQGVYFHPGYITESCRILLGGDAQAGAEEIEMSCGYQGESIKLSILGRHGILLDGMSYCLINHGEDAEHWVVGEVVGEQIVDEEEALLVARWAVIRVDQDEGQRLGTHVAASRRRMRIVYCTAEEAARRSSRVYDCIAAYNELAELKLVGDFETPSYYTLYAVQNRPDSRILLANMNPPWMPSNDRPTIPQIIIPEFANRRIVCGSSSADSNRAIIWGSIQLASSLGTASAHEFFRSSGRGECYTLRPLTLSTIPLQWVHVGQGAIPNSLADIPCRPLPIVDLLAKLNNVLGTSYPLETPGLRGCLEYAVSTSRDFGEVYGTLRSQWSNHQWPEGFVTILTKMKDRRDEDRRRRENAVRDHSIQDSRMPPRRVWDLYSNRVLPFYAMPWEDDEDSSCLPADLWTVSHSWVDEGERKLIITAINGRRWPVSIPRGTSLAHIRIELLNMGAKYVFLDVLCLRQEGNANNEKLRFEEWELDIPTVSHVYQAHPRGRPCITYFNGLGLPFDASATVLKSDRHWFNCLSTVQETVDSWLPGGLTAAPLSHSPNFFPRMHDLISSMSRWDRLTDVIQAVKSRNCPTDLDRISYLAYLLQCPTLPLYDRSTSLESAWMLLIKHMPSWARMSLFLQHESDAPFGLWISWRGLSASPSALLLPNRTLDAEQLQLVDPQQVHTNKPGQYYHATYATEPCYILSSSDDSFRNISGPPVFRLHFHNRAEPITVQVTATEVHGYLVPDVPYRLIGIGSPWRDCWVAAEVVGERDVQGKKAVEVIKWGVIHMDEDEERKFVELKLGEDNMRVIYLWGEEAMGRSGHVDKYMAHTPFEYGASVNAQAEDGRTPLHFAAQYGQIDNARTLLDHGAAVDARGLDECTPLHIAGKNGHVDIARTLLDRGAAVDSQDKDGWTPLHNAAQNGHADIARILLDRGAAVSSQNKNGWAPLHIAAENGHVDIARILLERGATVGTWTRDRWTPLHIAAQNGHADIVCTLLERGAAVDLQNKNGWTPLHIAAQNGHADIARTLLEGGAAVDSQSKDGSTPLHIAAQNGHVDIARILLERGAAVGTWTRDSWTPLHIAAQNGHADIARTLLDRGAAVDLQNKNGSTPLHIAAENGHADIARTLLDRGAAVDARGQDGWTPLLLTAYHGHADIACTLLDRGAAVDAQGQDGWTPLLLTAYHGHVNIARTLLERGAAVDSQNKNGLTPLHIAAQNGHADIARTLLERNAAVDTRGQDGWTPLHIAAQNGHVDIVLTFLDHGAAVDTQDKVRWTPLLYAAWNGHIGASRVLLGNGADVAAVDIYGFRALDHAKAKGHTEVMRLLLDHGAEENPPHDEPAA